MADKVIIIKSGTSFTIPNDWTNTNKVITVGRGGQGAQRNTGTICGGGGGAFAQRTNTALLNPGDVCTIQIGTAASAVKTFIKTPGGTTVAEADFGTNAGVSTHGTGGLAANSTGDITSSGGDGGGDTTTAGGHGGGAAGGPSGAGGKGGTSSSSGGSGGGGSNGGGNGVNSSSGTGGQGGTGPLGDAGGTHGNPGNPGTNGSGGGGGDIATGGSGVDENLWTDNSGGANNGTSIGPGSGGGGGARTATTPGGAAGHGGGSGGGGNTAGAVPGDGFIVLVYTPLSTARPRRVQVVV